uniref:GRIP domain-containing protein n=1 Tax=Monopterus albus TaxID=43700 RepID=A0A3Q3IM28_MONAL
KQDPGDTGAESAAPSPAGAMKSKLDTLSKDDLIKFAKKQMAAMQKMKSRCAGDCIGFYSLCEDLAALQRELDHMIEDHERKIKTLESSIQESNNKHQEEVTYFQKLLKEREESDRERESEKEKERQAEDASRRESAEEARHCLEAQLETLQAELEAICEQKSQDIRKLQESHQRELTEAQQEVENLKDELAQKSLQHEEEMRALEEDCEIERERLLLLQEELTEQLESARGSGIAKMLKLSGLSQGDSSHGDGEGTEIRRLKAALEDLQAQNTMLQDELTLLSNVKGELETELERAKEEYQTEREELEFKINELQMTRDSAPADPDPDQQEVSEEIKESAVSPVQDQNSLNPEEQQKLNQELRVQCETLIGQRDSALAECQQMRNILQGVETELNEKTNNFVLQYKAMKEQGTNTVQELQEKIEQLSQERDGLLKRVKELNSQNEEVLSKLQMSENMTQDLKELVNTLTEERDKIHSMLQLRDEEMQKVEDDRARETLLLREKKEKDLQVLEEEKQNEQQNLKEQMERREESVSALELSIKELSIEKADLCQKLEDTLSELSKAHEEREALGSNLADLEAHLEKELSEKHHLEVKINSLAEEAEQARTSFRALEENQSEALKKYTKETEELRECIEELEKERTLLRSRLEEVHGESRVEEVQKELQAHIKDLEQERSMLKANLEEVVQDTEGLQKDLQDMKSVSEKIKDENMKLQAQISLMTQEREEEEKGEMGAEMEKMEIERREFREQLTEKDSLISQLRNEVDALQVTGAHYVSVFMLLQNEALSSEKEDLLASLETIRAMVRQLEAQNQELQRQSASLDRDLLAERTMKEQKIKDLTTATKEVEELTAQLHRQQQQSQHTAQQLEQLRKEAQQNSLLGMEMADYERLVKELNTKLLERDESVEDLKAQINTHTQKEEMLKEEIESLKSQLDQGEEKTSKIKQLLVKTKKDLADAKKQESSLMMVQASLKGEMEANQQQLESSKIEVCELTAECHRLQEQLRSALEKQQRTSSSLQQHINSLQQERDTAQTELMATTKEFENYKVRVHNVLKQQKSKTTTQSEGDFGKLEREQLSSQVEQLRTRLAEGQQSLQSSAAELQQLQTEHDTLLERHNKILQETISKEAELRERLLSVQSENVALRSELTQAQADLSSQVEAQRQAYREQLRKLQDDHRATVETLQGQLARVEEQRFNLQNQNTSGQSGRKSLASDPQRRNTDKNQAGLGLVVFSDLQSMAREEGEGMETTENESPSPALTPLPSLEHLLTSPDPKQEPFVWTVELTKEELSQKLMTATRSMEHMNSLLHETEATNAVLMEQITLLKSEVRRLERNQEREKSVANLEYLKNVLLQFIFLRSGSERQALLPVIHTMLQLSPEEKSKLAAIAQGEEEGSGSRGSGWTSYLHSWSGIK